MDLERTHELSFKERPGSDYLHDYPFFSARRFGEGAALADARRILSGMQGCRAFLAATALGVPEVLDGNTLQPYLDAAQAVVAARRQAAIDALPNEVPTTPPPTGSRPTA